MNNHDDVEYAIDGMMFEIAEKIIRSGDYQYISGFDIVYNIGITDRNHMEALIYG